MSPKRRVQHVPRLSQELCLLFISNATAGWDTAGDGGSIPLSTLTHAQIAKNLSCRESDLDCLRDAVFDPRKRLLAAWARYTISKACSCWTSSFIMSKPSCSYPSCSRSRGRQVQPGNRTPNPSFRTGATSATGACCGRHDAREPYERCPGESMELLVSLVHCKKELA